MGLTESKTRALRRVAKFAAVVGVLVAAVSALADVFGIGTPGFGRLQVIGGVFGLFVVASSYWCHRWIENDLTLRDGPAVLVTIAVLAALPVMAAYLSDPGVEEPEFRGEASGARPQLGQAQSRGLFERVTIDPGAYGHRQVGDVDGDGRADIVVMNLAGPEELVWYRHPSWVKSRIALPSSHEAYSSYRADDLRVADIDRDGALDVVGRLGRASDDGDGLIVWWANPRLDTGSTDDRKWALNEIGHTDYVKDLVVADFDNDGKTDVAAREHERTHIFLQGDSPTSWIRAKTIGHHSHEGMVAADLDGDGDVDLVLNGFWLENPFPAMSETWAEHSIDEKWYTQSEHGWKDNNSNVAVGDVNGDGRPDVVLSQSELPGFPVSWYSSDNPRQGRWTEHRIADRFDYCQTLQVADFDRDGDLDVLAAEFPRYEAPWPVVIYFNDGIGVFSTTDLLTDDGIYHGTVADVGSDGDLDVVATRNYDRAPIEIWENLLSDEQSASWSENFSYIEVDNARSRRFFGLTAADVNGDGNADIAAGHYVYLNPGGDMTGRWTRVDLPPGHDALVHVDVDGDRFADLIAMTGDGKVHWLEAGDATGVSWHSLVAGSLPDADHGISSQGYELVHLLGGAKPEIVINADGLHYFEIPGSPSADPWPVTKIASGTSEGVGYGDIDRDGLFDLVACDGNPSVNVAWYKNPGRRSGRWARYQIGQTDTWCDRIEVADLNGDGRLDLASSEETQSTRPGSAKIYWFEAPAEPENRWSKHLVAAQYTTNSMDVADMDGDGDPDLITAEHRGSKKLSIWQNDGHGSFVEQVVARGIENHLGARALDLDGDGDLDIVGIAWDDYRFLHLWRNDTAGNRQ